MLPLVVPLSKGHSVCMLSILATATATAFQFNSVQFSSNSVQFKFTTQLQWKLLGHVRPLMVRTCHVMLSYVIHIHVHIQVCLFYFNLFYFILLCFVFFCIVLIVSIISSHPAESAVCLRMRKASIQNGPYQRLGPLACTGCL